MQRGKGLDGGRWLAASEGKRNRRILPLSMQPWLLFVSGTLSSSHRLVTSSQGSNKPIPSVSFAYREIYTKAVFFKLLWATSHFSNWKKSHGTQRTKNIISIIMTILFICTHSVWNLALFICTQSWYPRSKWGRQIGLHYSAVTRQWNVFFF